MLLCSKETIFIIYCFIKLSLEQSVVEESDDGNSGTISFKTPNLSDEESHSPWMPSQLKCDACRGIAFQFFESYRKFNDAHKNYKYNLPESEILDIAERVCDVKTYENYGLIEKKKAKRLKGPGLDTEDTPGIMQGGGKWPARMASMCDEFVGELGDTVIYEKYKKNRSDSKKFSQWLCEGTGLLGYCNKNDVKKEL